MNRNLRLYGGAILLLFLLAFFLYLVRAVAVPFLLALVLAYFLDPAADALERRKVPRTVAVVLVFALFLLVAGGAVAFLAPALREEMRHMQAALPEYAQSLYRLLPQSVFDLLGVSRGEELETLFDRVLAGTRNLSFDVFNQVAVFLSRAFSSTLGFLLAVLGYLIIPVYLFYLLRDFDRMREGILELFPPRHRPEIVDLAGQIDRVLGGFIRGQLTVCLILGILYSAGLAAIGVDLALMIGLISGVAFIIPYLGTILGIVLAGIMAAAEFRDLLHPLLVIGWFSLVQGLEGTVITPRLVGNRVGLHPLTTILAVLVGGDLFGFLGLLLAVPVTASANVVLRHLLGRYRRSSLFLSTGGEEI
jgi:predicted PurR-regulated permease PerM